MVSGEWGCGKTYYIRNIVIPELKKSRYKYKPVMVSLFGIDNVDDIPLKIMIEITENKALLNTVLKGINNMSGKIPFLSEKLILKDCLVQVVIFCSRIFQTRRLYS